LDKSLLGEVSKRAEQRDPKREQLLRQHRQEIVAELARSSARVSTEFPDYAELVSPRPVPLAQAQKLIAPGEALGLFHVGGTGHFVGAGTAGRVVWRTIDLTRAQLNDAVTKLRASVEKVEIPDRTLAKAFDLDLAYSLYSALLGPVEQVLPKDAHIIAV